MANKAKKNKKITATQCIITTGIENKAKKPKK